MKSLRFTANQLKLDEIPVPETENEALVRVLKSGICNTDLEIARGYAGFSGTIGHEFVGVVEKADNRKKLIGKRVVGEINVGCGKCDLCTKGDARHCLKRTVLGIHKRDGAHAGFLTLPERNLLEVPESISNEQAVFTEPLAAAFGITERISITPETIVAVVGDGKLGLLCAMCLRLKTANIVLIGKHIEKLSIAEKRNIESVRLADAVPKLNRYFDVVVEASGSDSGFATALDLLKPRGKLILKSTFQGNTNLEMWRVVVNEISIIGSRCGRFAPALELLAGGKIDVTDLITEELPLSKGTEAMRRAGEKGVLKILLNCER